MLLYLYRRNPIALKLNGKQVKCLRITLNQKLLWKTHAKNIFRKDTRALVICSSIAVKKSLDIVRPIITYGRPRQLNDNEVSFLYEI